VRRYRTTIVLFLVAVLLGGFYFLYLMPQMRQRQLIEDLKRRFFRSDTEVIDYIRIQAGPTEPYELRKTPEGWKIVRPRLLEVDMGMLKHFFKTLSDGKVKKVVARAESLRDFGIEKIYAVVAIGFGGQIEVLYLGGENPAKTGNYAYSERLKTVFLIDRDTARHLYLTLYDMREKRLFAFEKDKIGRIVIKRPSDTVELVRLYEGWTMVSPVRFVASEEEMDTLLEMLTTQKAEAFMRWSDKFETLKKKLWIGVYDRQGNLLSSGQLRYWSSEWDKQCVYRRDNEPEEAMRVSRTFWVALTRYASHYVDQRVFPGVKAEDIDSVIISYEKNNYEIRKNPDGWQMEGKAIRDYKITPLLSTLLRLSYNKILFHRSMPLCRESFFSVVLKLRTQDQRSLTVCRVDMQKEVSTSLMFAPVSPGSPRTRQVMFWLAESNSMPYPAVLNSEQIRTVVEAVRSL